MRVDVEVKRPKLRNSVLEQAEILKRPAAEADAIQAGLCANTGTDLGDSMGQRAMEPRGDIGGRRASEKIDDNCLNERLGIELERTAFDDLEWIYTFHLRRDHFQFNRGLRLVGCFVSKADDRGDGIEEPSARRGIDCLYAAVDHSADEVDLLARNFIEERKIQSQCFLAEGGFQMRQSASPRLAHGAVAPGERRVAKMRSASESGEIADQKLAAPDLAVGAIARAVKSNANDRFAKAIIRHATRNVCVVMLHADRR